MGIKSLSESLQAILLVTPSLSIPERSSWLVGTRIGFKSGIMKTCKMFLVLKVWNHLKLIKFKIKIKEDYEKI